MKDFVKLSQLEDVITQMNSVFKVLEGRIEKLEAAAAAKPTISRAKQGDK